ncbi:hypothetical protein FOG18_13645 (plasmid) [Legionella israelensis]|uniref:3'-5' exonuclease family protein n=1 Tax=Legionella israelensis TaxID=454 RepID=UPI00117D24CC|nr:3'-5' exonuclease family protein [Legionella israelensis]QDP73700.1 hypothetical protein FOG18_13645 [Legionella israelensis]
MSIYPHAIVDIETTGVRILQDSIIEIAIKIIDDSEIRTSWHSLIKPPHPIPQSIQALTGITNEDVKHAPDFEELAPGLYELLSNKLFIAHNANFDYAFLQNAFKRTNLQFKATVLCTLKLSGKLYPEFNKHHLDALIKRHELKINQRHSAMEDVNAVHQFIEHCSVAFGNEKLNRQVKEIIQKPNLPSHLKTDINRIPDTPGVYLFYENTSKNPIYIGKSIHLKTRILSHFNEIKSNNKEFKICQRVKYIEWIETAGELSALLLESKLIKENMPIYNHRLRKVKQLSGFQLIHTNDYLQIKIVHLDEHSLLKNEDIYGAFKSKRQAESVLHELVRTHALCPKLCHLEKNQASCFAFQLKRCFGACIQLENPKTYNQRVEQSLSAFKKQIWPFTGPIAIKEFCHVNQKMAFHVIDQWRYLGSSEHPENMKQLISQNCGKSLCLDEMNIIQGFILNKSNDCIRLDKQ